MLLLYLVLLYFLPKRINIIFPPLQKTCAGRLGDCLRALRGAALGIRGQCKARILGISGLLGACTRVRLLRANLVYFALCSVTGHSGGALNKRAYSRS